MQRLPEHGPCVEAPHLFNELTKQFEVWQS